MDRFVVYGILDESDVPSTWRARALLANGAIHEVELPFIAGVDPVVVGPVDANDDGRSEVFVITDRGASVEFMTLFEVHGDGVGQVLERDPEGAVNPARFAIGGSVTHGEGLACSDLDGDGTSEIVRLRVVLEREGAYRWERLAYRWNGGLLVFWKQDDNGLIEGDAKDPHVDEQLQPFYSLDCHGLRYPEPPADGNSGTVMGRVLFDGERPVPYPLIWNCWPGGSMSKWGGERDGSYRLRLPPGTYHLLAVLPLGSEDADGAPKISHVSDPARDVVRVTRGGSTVLDLLVGDHPPGDLRSALLSLTTACSGDRTPVDPAQEGDVSDDSEAPTSGVQGSIEAQPRCRDLTPPCGQPGFSIRDALIQARDPATREVRASTRSGGDGSFVLELARGRYELVASGGEPPAGSGPFTWECPTLDVTVNESGYVSAYFNCRF
ncbi:MAG TPA: hypothetical protein VGB52_14655 [Actinomycetota bacterium]